MHGKPTFVPAWRGERRPARVPLMSGLTGTLREAGHCAPPGREGFVLARHASAALAHGGRGCVCSCWQVWRFRFTYRMFSSSCENPQLLGHAVQEVECGARPLELLRTKANIFHFQEPGQGHLSAEFKIFLQLSSRPTEAVCFCFFF